MSQANKRPDLQIGDVNIVDSRESTIINKINSTIGSKGYKRR